MTQTYLAGPLETTCVTQSFWPIWSTSHHRGGLWADATMYTSVEIKKRKCWIESHQSVTNWRSNLLNLKAAQIIKIMTMKQIRHSDSPAKKKKKTKYIPYRNTHEVSCSSGPQLPFQSAEDEPGSSSTDFDDINWPFLRCILGDGDAWDRDYIFTYWYELVQTLKYINKSLSSTSLHQTWQCIYETYR